MKPIRFLLLVIVLIFTNNAMSAQGNKVVAASTLQSNDLDFFNKQTNQPVKVKLWYLASDANCGATVCLVESQNKRKIALISHGAFGSPIEMNWLGYALASQGWLVAGVAHYGESWVYGKETIDPSVLARFWQRPQEVSFALEQLTNKGLFNLNIDTNNVLMLGHSAGGFTALALAGAKLEAGKSERYCALATAKNDKSCAYNKQKTTPYTNDKISKISEVQSHMLDKRIKAVISLDPALGHAVNESSLMDVTVPTLVIGSVENDFLPFKQHAQYYAEHIKNAELVGIKQGAGHFIYINQCEHNFKAQGVLLCKDREGVDRKVLQQQVLGHVFSFINRHGLNVL
ncbi:alpha/beta hydrolase family protein [Pseudoalteromonas sp. XMcav1-K]|uniref:alpha/beta hydrolase family protein n=1 Tax=Pseudoalteromonas sp. XMcav1-K TaxID=3374372 RepID=UPI0037574416